MTQRYKVNAKVVEKGLEETIKLKINNLEVVLGCSDDGTIGASYKEVMSAIDLAKSTGIDVGPYYNVVKELEPQLKLYGIIKQ